MEKINVCVDKIQMVRAGGAGGPYNDFSAQNTAQIQIQHKYKYSSNTNTNTAQIQIQMQLKIQIQIQMVRKDHITISQHESKQ